MKAAPIYLEKKYFSDGSFQEIKIWKVDKRKDKPHGLKYSFAYIVNNERVVGYDNAEGKGDHKHYKGKEYLYKFDNLETLWRDFKKDIERYKGGKL